MPPDSRQVLVLGIVVHVGLALKSGDLGTGVKVLMLIVPMGVLIHPAHALTILEHLEDFKELLEYSN